MVTNGLLENVLYVLGIRRKVYVCSIERYEESLGIIIVYLTTVMW